MFKQLSSLSFICSRSILNWVRGLKKCCKHKSPVTACDIIVAIAAPAKPKGKTTINSQSKKVFNTPPKISTQVTMDGLPSLRSNVVKVIEIMGKWHKTKYQNRYSLAFSRISPCAPRAIKISRENIPPMRAKMAPANKHKLKALPSNLRALTTLPWPRLIDTNAALPMPIMAPIAYKIAPTG